MKVFFLITEEHPIRIAPLLAFLGGLEGVNP
jgi:hypothetical protein